MNASDIPTHVRVGPSLLDDKLNDEPERSHASQLDDRLRNNFDVEPDSSHTPFNNFILDEFPFVEPESDDMTCASDDTDIWSVGYAVETYTIDHHMVEYNIPTAKCGGLTPVTIMACKEIGLQDSYKLLRVLLDTGSMKTLINKRCIPRKARTFKTKQIKKITTIAGKLMSEEYTVMRDCRMPEFDRSRSVDQQKALVFDNPDCRYDLILGADW